VLVEQACEPSNKCNNDQYSFKAYASRYLGKTAVLAPYALPAIRTLLTTSAQAVAQACSSGPDNATCGQKWYVGGFDGNPGIGQQMSALEAVQALLPVLPRDSFLGTNGSNTTGTRPVQNFVPRTAPSVTIAARDVTSTFVAGEPTGSSDGSPRQPSGGNSGSGGENNNESVASPLHGADSRLAAGLLVVSMIAAVGYLNGFM